MRVLYSGQSLSASHKKVGQIICAVYARPPNVELHGTQLLRLGISVLLCRFVHSRRKIISLRRKTREMIADLVEVDISGINDINMGSP